MDGDFPICGSYLFKTIIMKKNNVDTIAAIRPMPRVHEADGFGPPAGRGKRSGVADEQ